MRRILLITLSLALVLAACTGTTVEGDFEDVGVESTPTSSTSAPPTSDANSPGDTAATSTTVAVPEGPVAPDFTLALEPSGRFVLSQEVKPVYMVFWAEW
ncbi:MAG: hypothetical protein QGM46_08890 [Actinomycetota bacterium]|nr:hypothetical protein [Actinomycetota bacterium]MDK1016980.1 hypothetical protein [Actinomycetota bacterium]MDK1026771.1 hypothetical protein [Actinomycetota bacterium]MDK1039197.1 hypothetical protein [Actinomycetota bacterium]MDK1097275.1 hypothetical protein [Actinomycetota bacterium]